MRESPLGKVGDSTSELSMNCRMIQTIQYLHYNDYL